MSCSPFDLREYVLNELADSECRQVETHMKSCAACSDELERLRTTQAALLSLADEEIPQRIGFVSDRVFEPSTPRRWWAAFWGSSARLGFASAAMLSIAIVVSALTRPAPAPPAPIAAHQPDMARIEAQFERRLGEAVARAVAQAEARQEARTRHLLAATEARHNLEMKGIQLAVEQNLTVLERRYTRLRMDLASADFGGTR
ncbi:MAG TPA: zf-HC2 domain-containing protein [Bryobacteraceae bacterium]|nr:zf-HC2 domain-containing protein [Bryobacteraceae bacterium]